MSKVTTTTLTPPAAGKGKEVRTGTNSTEKKKEKRPRKIMSAQNFDATANSNVQTYGSVCSGETIVPDEFLQPVGQVVHVLQSKYSRCLIVGHVVPFKKRHPDERVENALFVPVDERLPSMRVPLSSCPKDLLTCEKTKYKRTMFAAKFIEWTPVSMYAHGTIVKILGEIGSIEGETLALLSQNGFEDAPFSNEILDCLPNVPNPEATPTTELKDYQASASVALGQDPTGWEIPAEEITKRKDLRSTRIFTIDPLTARDLDDALHVTALGDGLFEVGVHIADVSYFVRNGTALDNEAQNRCTSVYLVQKVIPMLPGLLSEHLCSLNPGTDRFAFSIIWRMDKEGNIKHQWIGKTIIRSCVKMNYETAQRVLDAPADRVWTTQDFPPIYGLANKSDSQNGSCTVPTPLDIAEDIKNFWSIGKELRRKREESGSIRLDKVKIGFSMDSDGKPTSFFPYVQKESNKLVEEFMLLANISAATAIFEAFPYQAVLRCHPPPLARKLEETIEELGKLGIVIDGSSSKSLQQSLINVEAVHGSTCHTIVQLLLTKAMQPAQYFCTEGHSSLENHSTNHYALSVPLYTHFTSPIRRYPDIIVHRLLELSIEKQQCLIPSEEMEQIATRCNERKQGARAAQEQSTFIYLCSYIKNKKTETKNPSFFKGYVFGIMDQSFEVYIPAIGIEKRIYCRDCVGDEGFQYHSDVNEIDLYWKSDQRSNQRSDRRDKRSGKTTQSTANIQRIKMFSSVIVKVQTLDEKSPVTLRILAVEPGYECYVGK